MANRLITYFVGEDVSMKSTLNEISGSVTNTGRRLDELGRSGGQNFGGLSRELDRFKRHFGYATAGLATYEIFNAIGRLRDYQNELSGLNATLQETPTHLQEFASAAFDISTRTGVALDEVFQSMQNIINSFPQMSQAVRRHFVPAAALIEAQGARVAQTTPQQFGATVTTLADVFFGRAQITRQGPALLDRIAREIIETQRSIPNPAGGQQFLSSMPTLAQGANTAGFNLEQALGLYTIAQRALGNPRTTSQYLRQLFTRLNVPTRSAQPFFQQAGLGSEQLANMTGPQIMQQLMQYGLTLPGGVGGANNATPDQVQAFMRQRNWGRFRVTGEAAQFFRQSIGGRIQSNVAMTALLQNLRQYGIAQNNLRNAPTLESRIRSMDLSMSQAGQAFTNITTELGTTLLPAIDPLAQGLVRLEHMTNRLTTGMNQGRNILNQHTHGIPLIGGHIGDIAEIGGIIGAGFLGRRVAQGVLGRLAGRAIRNPLAAEQGLMITEAAGNALAGKADGSATAPFWVVIHPLSKSQVPELFNGGIGRGGAPGDQSVKNILRDSAAAQTVKRVIGRAGGRAITERIGVSGAEALGAAGLGAAAITGYYGIKGTVAVAGGHPITSTTIDGQVYHVFPDGTLMRAPGAATGRRTLANQFIRQLGGHNIPHGLQPYFRAFESGQIPETRLNRAIQNYVSQTMRASGGHPQGFLATAITEMFRLGPGHQMRLSHVNRRNASSGYVEATLTLEPTQEFRNLIRPQQVQVHIPIGDLPAPTSRGKTRVPRRGR